MTTLLCACLTLLLCAPACAKETGGVAGESFDEGFSGEVAGPKEGKRAQDGEEASDSEILGAVREAEESTLDSAMQRAPRDAQASLEDALALILDARQEVQSAQRELKPLVRRRPALEDELDVLVLSAQMLSAKAESFRQGASSAALSVPELDEEGLAARRTGYRTKDRARDLQRAQTVLKKAAARFKKAPALSASESALLDQASACLSEVRHASEALSRASRGAAPSKKDLSKPEAAGKDGLFASRVERLDEDAEGLSQEMSLLGAYLKLRRVDEDSFDQSR